MKLNKLKIIFRNRVTIQSDSREMRERQIELLLRNNYCVELRELNEPLSSHFQCAIRYGALTITNIGQLFRASAIDVVRN